MQLRVSGKNMDIGDALRQRVEDRLETALEKYFDDRCTGHTTISKNGVRFHTECVIHLPTGIILEASAESHDANSAFDNAAEKLDKRLRRYKRRLKDHHGRANQRSPHAATAYVLSAPAEEEVDDEPSATDDHAAMVIAERQATIPWLSVAEAAIALDLSEAPALVFKHAASERINVVYRRPDGNIGWVDPSE